MKNKKRTHILQAMLAILLITVLTAGLVMMPNAEAARQDGFTVNRLDGLKVDYEKYLDNAVMYQLPENIRDDEEISVIITLEQINLMDAYEGTDKAMSFRDYALESSDAQQLKETIYADRAELLSKLDEKNIAYTTGEVYDTLLTGYELVIKAGDYGAVCQSLGKGSKIVVGEVYKSAEAQLVENTVNVYETGIFKSGESGYDGTGMVVAVLDTGLDSKHTAFSTSNFTSNKLGLTYEQVAAVIDQTKAKELAGALSVDDVYINEKVPFGYDYADNDPDVFSTHNNHGTHVSGVIVGKDDTITGVAPNAQLVSMKVFSDIMDTARASWILSALEDCVILGVDVINMSLGTACGFSRESDEEILNGVYDKIRAAGISMVVAASNSYSSAYGSEANGNLGLTSVRYDRYHLFIIGFVLVIITLAVLQNFIRSKHGRAVTSIRDSEIAARATGINVTKYKLSVFTISSFFAGIAGVLFSFSQFSVQPSTFDYNYSIEILVMVVLGGMGSLGGSLISASLITFLNEQLQIVLTGDRAVLKDLLYALILIVLIIYRNAPALKSFREKISIKNLLSRFKKPKDPSHITDDEHKWDRVPTKIEIDEVLSLDLQTTSPYTPDKPQKEK